MMIRDVASLLLVLCFTAPARMASGQGQRVQSEFEAAIRAGDVSKIRGLIKKGEKINEPLKGYGIPPLALAGDVGSLAVVKLLVENGGAVDGDVLCSAAASEGKLETVKYLVGHGAGSAAVLGLALNCASGSGRLETANFLVETGASLDYARTDVGWTPLISAAYGNSVPLVKFLLEKGANFNAANKNGETALHMTKSPEIAKLLLEKGANIDAADKDSSTPLLNAVKSERNLDLAKLLVAKGAHVNAANSAGDSPLAEAIGWKTQEMTRILLEAGADAKIKDQLGNPLLCDAALAKDVATVKLLLEHGADPNDTDKDDGTPLRWAYYSPEIARALLEHGANPDIETKGWKTTPLYHLASAMTEATTGKYGRQNTIITDVAKLLVEHGADLNAPDAQGCTPLQAAAWWNHLDVERVLVANGADVNAKEGCPNDNNPKPLREAVYRGQLDLVKLLLEAGSTETPDQDLVCVSFHADGNHEVCPKERILALLANPPAPIIKLAQIAKEMREVKKGQAAASSPAPATEPKRAEPTSDADEPRYHSAERPHDLAVIVGIEKYGDGLPDATFAERDARAVRKHLLALGYAERNIFMLTGAGATKSGFVKNLETRLPALAKPDSTVFIYYSGHGAPDAETGKAYLLPVDGDPQFLKDTAYPLSQLYAALGKLPVKRVIVALDSCFSGAGGRSVIAKGTRPLVVKVDAGGALSEKIVALTASSGSQTSGVIDAQGHGAFTYYLLRGLNGAAKGDDGTITVQSLYDYLTPNVEDAARRENRDQAPQFLRSEGAGARRILLR